MAASIEQVNMTEGALLPKVLRFSLPLAATGILQLLFNAADVIVVGKFAGATALAAVGATTALINLLVNAFMGISVGVNILVARYLGCREDERVRACVHTAFALSLLLGLVVMAAGLTLSTPMLELMKTPKDVLPLSSLYLRIYFLGIPGTIMYNFGAALLRAFGDTKRPMLFLTVSGIVNACLNLFFVIVCGMSVDGVATATVISQYISLFLVVRCLRRSEGLSHLELKSIRLDREESLRMIQIGLPAGLQSTLFSISNVLIQSSVNSFGASVVAANTAAASIEGFVYTAMNSVFHAAITFTSQNLGAQKYDRAKTGARFGIISALLLAELIGIAMYLTMPQLASLFSRTPEVIALATRQARVITLFYCLLAYSHAVASVCRGAGKAFVPMLVMLAVWCVLRITYISLIMRYSHEIRFIYYAYPITWSISSVIFFIYYHCSDWVHGFDAAEKRKIPS